MQFVKHELGNFAKAVTAGFFYAVLRLSIPLGINWFSYQRISLHWGDLLGVFFGFAVVSFLYYWVLSLTDELHRFESGEKGPPK